MRMSEIFPRTAFNIPSVLNYETEKLIFKSGLVRSGETLTFYPLGAKVIDKIKDAIINILETENYLKIYQEFPSIFDIKREINSNKVMPLKLYLFDNFSLYFYEITKENEKLKDIVLEILIRTIKEEIKDRLYLVEENNDEIIYAVTSEKTNYTFLHCPKCLKSYSVNYVGYKEILNQKNFGKNENIEKVYTPGAKTISDLCSYLKVSPEKTIKTLIYKIYFDNKEEYIAALVKGSRNINEEKLKRVLGAKKIQLADEEEIKNFANTKIGYAGPIGLNMKIIADKDIMNMENAIVGANEEDFHFINVIPAKDFKIDIVCDIKENIEKDPCPNCFNPMEFIQGQKLGSLTYNKEEENVFINGQLDLSVLFYIINEVNKDSEGLIFDREFSPALCYIIPINVKNEKIFQAAEGLYDKLKKYEEVIIDDREESPGVKFKDADLLGIPYKIIIGNKFVKEGKIEVKERKTGRSFEVELRNINIEFFNSL